jgi:hypothetical protein
MRELSVAEQRYQAVLAVISDGLSISRRAVCNGLRAALASYGAPEQILTDNGKALTGRLNHPPVEVLRLVRG